MKADYKSLASSSATSIFLYGTHEAYLAHKLNAFVKKLTEQKAQTQWVDQATFLSDPSLLHNQGDLFAPASAQRVVIIQEATDKSAKTVEAHLLSPNKGVRLVIPALVGTSVRKLKTLHEKAKSGAFVPCYLNQGRDMQDFLTEIKAQHGLKLDREAQTYVSQRIEQDLESILSAFEKLEFFMSDKQAEVTVSDIEACIADFSEANVEPFVVNIGERHLPGALRAYHEAKSLGLEEVYMLRSLSIRFAKLMAIRSLMSEGMNIAQALQAQRPPVFFKQAEEFKRQVIKWPEKDLAKAMNILNTIELKIKTGFAFDTTLLWKPLFSMCRVA